MPELCHFYGIRITLYFDDHEPPHFHATYAGDTASIAIASGDVIAGGLPRRAGKLVEEWRHQHADELAAAWNRAKHLELPGTIEPLA